jgi:hypothetical protein
MASDRLSYVSLGTLVLLSRIPFLGRGFGVEEDAWGTAVAVRNTIKTGVFETSRLPGHPVNEFFYLLLWPADSWWFNLSSALCSVVFALSFFRLLRDSGISSRKAFFATLACCLIPVVYVSSTCTMDYIWGLMFMTLSWWMVFRKNHISAGIFLGLAAGCRITMAGMFFPFVYLIWHTREKENKSLIRFSFSAIMTGLLVFFPVIQVYGPGFFTYSDQFPYPSWPKVFYKLSIGVWGLPGIMALVLWSIAAREKLYQGLRTNAGVFVMLTCLTYTGVYFILPQKSAYMISLVPVCIYFFVSKVEGIAFYCGIALMIFSSFVFGFNLSDPYRGAESKSEIFSCTISGQEVFLDGFGGPITHDYSKRKLKNEYCKAIMKKAAEVPGQKSVICGWWYNQLLIYSDIYGQPANTQWLFYADTTLLHDRIKSGQTIYFLAEQDVFNDLMFSTSDNIRKARFELLP